MNQPHYAFLSVIWQISVSSVFVSSWLVLFMELHHYIIMRSQIVVVPFALYICAKAIREKMSSGNANTAFVSNCDHNYNYMARIRSIVV